MEEFWNIVALSLVTGIVSGVVAGLYTGLVVSRLFRFQEIISTALEVIDSVESGRDREFGGAKGERLKELQRVISRLLHFGHWSAAERIGKVNLEVASAISATTEGRMTADDLEALLSDRYDSVRNLSPGLRIFIPWGAV